MNCKIPDCENEVYLNEKKCILHCEKSKYLASEDIKYYEQFFIKLRDYTYIQAVRRLAEIKLSLLDPEVKKKISEDEDYSTVTDETLKAALNPNRLNESVDIHHAKFINRHLSFVYKDINFPSTKNNNSEFNYINILTKSQSLNFEKCSFWISELPKNINKLFKECEFKCDWNLQDSVGPLPSYRNCIFFENVYLKDEKEDKIDIRGPMFYCCEFIKKLEFINIRIINSIFISDDNTDIDIDDKDIERKKLTHISFLNCIIEEKFLLNKYEIDCFEAEDTVFNSKFEFKYNLAKCFKIVNTNFKEMVDAYRTKYTKFNIKKSIFYNFVGFEKCEFGIQYNNDKENIAVFVYATFHDFVNFRSTIFHSGLNIENINLTKSPNFLNTSISTFNTNRETFRIIKHSFDETRNMIEANKFFAEEMKKYKEEVNKKGNFQEKLILNLNSILSDFGQDYLKPIGWLAVSAAMYYFLQYGHAENWLYRKNMPINEFFGSISYVLNEFAKIITPLEDKFLHEGMEFVSLVFYIINSSLIWLTIVAIKRKTKR